MIKENETAPNVFTDAGEQWVDVMVEALRNSDFDKSKELGHHKSWKSINFKNGMVPEAHPDFGRLIKPSEEPQYLLISTHDRSQDVTKKVSPSSVLPDDHPTYAVENFGKVRIYSEAVTRNVGHLFAPITGWDGQEFSWITMPVVSNIQRSDGGTRKADPLKDELKNEDPNWVVHDEEVGEHNGEQVLLDYGMFWYEGDWKVSESQLFDP
ncbi:hypothetical protein OB919_15885 [Halobacteria archaeon AArc-curdl1]|uniref:Uncharacterized protein n=1 Tax=Natronosalvus hydrolyticus TaxID=2979988 RepID=A0AAP3E805_9EURY|nr:hypothetical protein [Halobacteria archaeon AArc-curdl1]